MGKWLFVDPPNVAVFTTSDVLHNDKPILLVSHDEEDGAWQFHNNAGEISELDGRVVSLAHIINLDSSIIELHDLPLGWSAWRKSKETPWIRIRNKDNQVD